MHKSFISLVFLLLPITLFAQFDLQVGTQARSYPGVGFEGFIDTGYNYVFWGEYNPKKPFYGLIRPSMQSGTSVVVNNIQTQLEFYPISFLGIVIGKQFIRSDFDFPNYDCEKIICRGNIEKKYIEYRLALGYKGFVSINTIRQDENTYYPRKKPFAEFRTAMIADAHGENAYSSRHILGVQKGKELFGIGLEYSHLYESNQKWQQQFLVYQKQFDDYALTYGFGTFNSSYQDLAPIVLFRLHYNIFPTKRLF
jgi:hypothetical protein